MDIVKLKESIEKNTLDDSLLILEWQDSDFIAQQYVKAITKNKSLEILYAHSLEECSGASSFFEEESNYLYVMNVETFESKLEDFVDFKNVVIICKEVKNAFVNSYVVKIPKLETWQINDYMTMKCEGVNIQKLNWLQKISNNDIYRIDNEIGKLSIFRKEQQDDIFNLLNEEGGYGDLSDSNFYDFTNAIKMKDINKLKDLLIEISNIDVEPMGIVTMLHRDFKLITDVKLTKLDTQEEIDKFTKANKMSLAQFKFYKNNLVRQFDEGRLAKTLKFLDSVDYDLKSGNLGVISSDKDRFIDYIVCNLVSI